MTHQEISFIKSVVRMGGFTLLTTNLLLAAFILIVAEWIGVYEEYGN